MPDVNAGLPASLHLLQDCRLEPNLGQQDADLSEPWEDTRHPLLHAACYLEHLSDCSILKDLPVAKRGAAIRQVGHDDIAGTKLTEERLTLPRYLIEVNTDRGTRAEATANPDVLVDPTPADNHANIAQLESQRVVLDQANDFVILLVATRQAPQRLKGFGGVPPYDFEACHYQEGCQDKGPQQLRGSARHLHVYELRGAKRLPAQAFEFAMETSLVPISEDNAEVARLERAIFAIINPSPTDNLVPNLPAIQDGITDPCDVINLELRGRPAREVANRVHGRALGFDA
mmetsp:Transcript_121298/g.302726  ORF Transcript_121298/g.302726 Transcript_121298/m.302726 type:complete len:288 (+) Transcript_121298:899-1762(+)